MIPAKPLQAPQCAGLLALALCMSDTPAAALAETSSAPQEQAPGFYHQQIGRLRVTALFDGVVALPRAQLHNIDESQKKALIDRNYIPESAQGLQTAVNAYLVQDGRHLTLVDTGTAQCFGPALGQVLHNLRRAGYAPEQVDTVLLTHAHPDHMCGLLDPHGNIAYPNATVWLAQADADYWLDPASEATARDMFKPVFGMARHAVQPYERTGQLRRFTPDMKLPDGITAVPSQGHTPGHMAYRFDGGRGKQLLVWGDLVHYHAVQFVQPDASFEADYDRAQAIASRRRLMGMAADGGWWVAGAHLPFPGLGHVGRSGDAYVWIPTEYAPLPEQ